jgi:hypothetical protein
MVFSASHLAFRLQNAGEYRRAYRLLLWLLREYGARLLPAERDIVTVDIALFRQGRDEEAQDLVEAIDRRFDGHPMRRAYFRYVVAVSRTFRHPRESLTWIEDVDRLLKREGWEGIGLAQSIQIALLLAVNGKFDEIRTRFPDLHYLDPLFRGDRDAARDGILEIMPEDSTRWKTLAPHLAYTLLCLGDLESARPLVERLKKIDPNPHRFSSYGFLSFLEKLVAGRAREARAQIAAFEDDPDEGDSSVLCRTFSGTEDPIAMKNAWRWGWMGLNPMFPPEAPWALDLIEGIRCELAEDRAEAARHYAAADKSMRWKMPAWYFVQDALERVKASKD